MQEVVAGERLLRRIEWTSGVLLVALPAAAWVFFSWRMALGVFLGGGIAVLSFQVLKRQLRRAFQDPDHIPGKASIFVSYYLRFLGSLFLVFVVIYYGWATPVAFLVGLSVMVLSIGLVGGVEILATLSKKGER